MPNNSLEELRAKVERLVGTAILKNDKNYTDDIMAVIVPYIAEAELRLETKIRQLATIGDLEIVKHLPEIDDGFNVGIEFDDGVRVSVPGESLEEAIDSLMDYWKVKANLTKSQEARSE